MYMLTICDNGLDVSTLHDTPEAAHAALHTYLVLFDYYHQPTQVSAAYSASELITLTATAPRVVGVATIEPYTELDAQRDLNIVSAALATPALAS
ncbi:MAG: hypothetical protein K0U84_08880 [Actinomycetia bacterium]|nr:hypothetical protein [Actinomycetes bacterium]